MASCRRNVRLLPAALAALAIGACGGATAADSAVGADGRTAAQRSAEPTSTPRAPSAAETTAEATITPERRPITIAFAGDIHFEGQVRDRLADPESALEPISTQLSAADLTVVNLESAIGVGGTREPKRFTFQAPPSALTALAAAGVDVVTMANNHAADYGLDGLHAALDAAASAAGDDPPLAVVGIGANDEEAFAPAMFEIDGTSVAVLGASAADDDPTADPTGHWAARSDRAGTADATDSDALIAAVEDAAQHADVVVAYLHWGIQGESCPSDHQTTLAAALADAGASIVVGSHTHRLQGAGMLGDTYVAYGLGNFIWYTQASEATSTTGLLTLTIDGGRIVNEEWAPAQIGSGGLPSFADGAQADQMTSAFHDLRGCTVLAPVAP